MTRNKFIQFLKKAKRHKDPEITFWVGDDEYEIERMGEFEISNEITITFKKIENPAIIQPMDINKLSPKWKKKFKAIEKQILTEGGHNGNRSRRTRRP